MIMNKNIAAIFTKTILNNTISHGVLPAVITVCSWKSR